MSSHFAGVEQWWGASMGRKSQCWAQGRGPGAVFMRSQKTELWMGSESLKVHVPNTGQSNGKGLKNVFLEGALTLLFLLPENSWCQSVSWGQLDARDGHTKEGTLENASRRGHRSAPFCHFVYQESPVSWEIWQKQVQEDRLSMGRGLTNTTCAGLCEDEVNKALISGTKCKGEPNISVIKISIF